MKQFILLLLAITLLSIFAPIGVSYALFKKDRNVYFMDLALSIDQFGNVVMSKIFNQWMLKAGIPYTNFQPYLFGNIDETVSSVMGKNELRGTLTRSGKFLNKILNKLDSNHSINSIEKNP